MDSQGLQRKIVTPLLDVGHSSFETFIDERLDKLKNDLMRECDRIASARELALMAKLAALEKANEGLRSKSFEVKQQVPPEGAPAGQGAKSYAEPSPMKKEAESSSVASREAATAEKQIIVSLDSPHCPVTPVSLPAEHNGDSNRSESALILHPEAPMPRPRQSVKLSKHYRLWEDYEHGYEALRALENDDPEELDQQEAPVDVEMARNFSRGTIAYLSQHHTVFDKYTVKPTSVFTLLWEVAGIPVLMFDVVTIPLRVFHDFQEHVFDLVSWIIILYWTCDVFLRMFVIGYTDMQGQVQLHRKMIMRHYIKGSFTFDLCMVGPDWFSKIFAEGGVRSVAVFRTFRIVRLVRLARMGKVKRMMRHLEDRVDSEYFSVICKIIQDVLIILLICHYLGCFWFYLGTLEFDHVTSWIYEEGFDSKRWADQYIGCLHWALAQFTPGAAKPAPRNFMETAYVIFVLIFGMVFVAMFISGVTQERMRLQARASKFTKDNWILRRYLHQRGVSPDLVIRTIRYVDTCVAPMLQRVNRTDVYLLPFLSKPLQLELQEEIFWQTLNKHPLLERLRRRSEALTLHLFVNVVIEVMLASGDVLFETGEVAHEMFFLSQGVISYFRHGRDELHIHRTEWCCEPVLWVPWLHKGIAKGNSDSHVVSIDSAKLRAAVLEHKERTFVIAIAHAFLLDLNQLVDEGVNVDDCTRITDKQSSKYMEAMSL